VSTKPRQLQTGLIERGFNAFEALFAEHEVEYFRTWIGPRSRNGRAQIIPGSQRASSDIRIRGATAGDA